MTGDMNFKDAQKVFAEAFGVYVAAPTESLEAREAWRKAENILQSTLDAFGEDRNAVEWVWMLSKIDSPLEDRAVEMLRHFK